jgi:hypothetical protein
MLVGSSPFGSFAVANSHRMTILIGSSKASRLVTFRCTFQFSLGGAAWGCVGGACARGEKTGFESPAGCAGISVVPEVRARVRIANSFARVHSTLLYVQFGTYRMTFERVGPVVLRE